MSVDMYFCFCCMSTNDLSNLCSYNTKNNYVEMIKVLTSIHTFEEECDDEGFICKECISRLQEAVTFKKLIFETLGVLHEKGLIKLCKIKDTYLVKKVTEDEDAEEDVKVFSEIKLESTEEQKKSSPVAESKVKSETKEIEINNSLKTALQKNNITRMSENDIILKNNEKNMTVARKKKRDKPPKKTDLSYKVTVDLKCKICSEVMPNVKVFHTHMDKHFPNHICETCGKGFATERRRKRHVMSHSRGNFPCVDCDAVFNNYNTYSSHKRRLHSSVLTYACPVCPQRFGTFTRRARHLADEHEKTTEYRCHACPKTFLISGQLSSHVRSVHEKVIRHRCTECNVGYFYKQELMGHMATHTGVNLFKCDLCSKSYPRKHSLTTHMKTHTGEKRFCCETCGKSFTQKCILSKHYKMHLRRQDTDRRGKLNEQLEKTEILKKIACD